MRYIVVSYIGVVQGFYGRPFHGLSGESATSSAFSPNAVCWSSSYTVSADTTSFDPKP